MHIILNTHLPPRATVSSARTMYVGRETWAMLNAQLDNQGRDWRRIKREVNKAARRAKREIHGSHPARKAA